MAYARERMEALAGEARAILERYPPGDARDALIDLVDYTVTRNR